MAMFEQEIEMEKRQSSVVPLLLIVCLIISVVGVAGYYLIQTRKVVSNQEASAIVAASMRSPTIPITVCWKKLDSSSLARTPALTARSPRS